MWTVAFNDYMKFDGVKESIKYIQDKSKASLRGRARQHMGLIMEDYITEALEQTSELAVEHTTPQMDYGFGADYKCSYQEGGKHYSFYLDVTMAEKHTVSYINGKGVNVTDMDEAYVLEMKDFEVRFGFKERHAHWFFYHKPVVVMSVRFRNVIGENVFRPLDVLDANNLAYVLKTVNSLLVEQGYGARASQKVRPNPKVFAMEYNSYQNNQ